MCTPQAEAVRRRLDFDGVVEVLGGLAVDRDDAAVAEVPAPEQVLLRDLLGRSASDSSTTGSGNRGGRSVRAQDDLDVDAGLAQEPQPLLDDAVRDAARVGEGRQPRLDDLAFAGAVGLSVGDADDGVDLRVVRQDDLACRPASRSGRRRARAPGRAP